MKKSQEELIRLINLENFAVFGFIKIKDKIILVQDKGKFIFSKWKNSGGGGTKEKKDFSNLSKINFVRAVLQRKIFRETGIILDAKDIAFVKNKDGHSFVFMMTSLDHSSRRIPKAGKGIKKAKSFTVQEVKDMIEREEVLENHALALKEVLE